MRSYRYVLVSLMSLTICHASLGQTPIDASFTYQGRLSLDGTPVNGTADFQFTLWDAFENGNPIGSTVSVDDFLVADGLFTVQLDFGTMAFNGDARWLAVSVRSPAGSGAYTTLGNLQALTTTPFASYAIEAGQVMGGITGVGTTGTLSKFTASGEVGDSVVIESEGNVGVGVQSPQAKLAVDGEIESLQGGFRFPDGSTQTTANSQWQQAGSDIWYQMGRVGIGNAGAFLPSLVGSISLSDAVLPTPRRFVAAATDSQSGHIYCFGGNIGQGFGNLDEIVRYDPVADTVTTASGRLPTIRNAVAAAYHSGTQAFYVFGGVGPSGLLDEIVKYDPALDAVITMQASLTIPRSGAAAAAYPGNGRIYVFGGNDGGTEILEFDPIADSIVLLPATLPDSRFEAAAVFHPVTDRIYCVGGTANTQDILEFNPNTGEIAVMEFSLPSRRNGLAAAYDTTTQRIITFDGSNSAAITVVDPINGVAQNFVTKLPSGRQSLGAAASEITGLVYAFGGESPENFDEIFKFDATSETKLQVGTPGDGSGALANQWATFSSREYKTDIVEVSDDGCFDILHRLTSTPLFKYRYKSDPRCEKRLGVIAEQSPPEILAAGGKAVSLAEYNAFLLAAIKAQQLLLDEKDARLYSLEQRMTEIESRINQSTGQKGGQPR